MIGALSLVIVVWLGTSVSVSRRSTLTGRSTIGIRNRRPGSRTIASFVLPRRNTTIRSYCCTTRTDEVQDHEHHDEDEAQGDEGGDEFHVVLQCSGLVGGRDRRHGLG